MLRIEGVPDARYREAVDDAVRRHGGASAWRTHPALELSYGLVECSNSEVRNAIAAFAPVRLYETAIIALAVSPTVSPALPSLHAALGGGGAPAAVLESRLFRDTLLLEWNPDVASPVLLVGLIDVELRRFASGRTIQLLSPLPPYLLTRMAADGLGAPEIEPKRVLDLLVDDA